MHLRVVRTGVALASAALLGLSACQRKLETPDVAAAKPKADVAVDLVKETERSKHFAAVNRQLELGGTLYGYVDVDGDVLKLIGGVQDFIGELSKTEPKVVPFAAKDYAAIATTLGLTDIKAIGASSVAAGQGYFRNRMFFYTGGERHGLIAGLGGKPGPFTHAHLAPADTSVYAEAELDLPVVYAAVKQVIQQIAGEPAGSQFEEAVRKAGEKTALSVFDLIHGLKGHSSLVLRLDAQTPMLVPGKVSITMPGISLLISVDGVAPIVERSLAKLPLKKSEVDGLRVYALPGKLPIEGLAPVIVADGNTLRIASTLAFLQECRTRQTGLAQNQVFKGALAAVGGEGNGLLYVAPALFDQLRSLEAMNPDLPKEPLVVLKFIIGKLPRTDRPMVAIRSNVPDGVLVRSHWDRSLKQEIALVSAYNPLTMGLFASMAIPAFQKVRKASQEKAVLGNLRMLSVAADQYYLESGNQMATYDQLVGAGRVVRTVLPIVGENYRSLRFVQGQPLRLQLPDGRTIQYPPAAPPAGTAPGRTAPPPRR